MNVLTLEQSISSKCYHVILEGYRYINDLQMNLNKYLLWQHLTSRYQNHCSLTIVV